MRKALGFFVLLVHTFVSPALANNKSVHLLADPLKDPSRAKASGTQVSIATETVVYCEDFNSGDGGWTPLDIDATETPTDVFWHVDNGDWFCAAEDSCFVSQPGPGYGNDWDQRLDKTYALPSGTVTLNFFHAYDTESSFDLCEVQVLPEGAAEFVTLAAFFGNSGGTVHGLVNLSPYAGTTVEIRFRFSSNASFSDEDGLFTSGGAWRIDRLSVSGHPEEDFTSEQGWTPSAAPLTSTLATFRLVADPVCDPPADYLLGLGFPASGGLNCNHPSPCASPLGGNAWVAFDPDTGEIPPVPSDYDRLFNPGIESPEIAIPAPVGTPEYRLEVDIFRDQIFSETRIVWQQSFAFPEPGCPPSFNRRNLWQSLREPVGWAPFTRFFFPPPGATNVKVRLSIGDWANITNISPPVARGRGPYFDNIRIVHVTAPPGPPIVECVGNPVHTSTLDCTFPAPQIGLGSIEIVRVLDDTTPPDELIFNQDPPAGAQMSSGDLITISVTDQDGNTSSECQVQRFNNREPVLNCPADAFLIPDASGQAVYTGPAPTSTDGCMNLLVTSDPPLPATFGLGTHTITYTAHKGTLSRQCDQTITVGDPAGAIANLISLVQGFLGNDRGLIRKLEDAIRLLEKGNTGAAVNKLQDFTDQVAARVNSGALTQDQGDELTELALSIVEFIEATPKAGNGAIVETQPFPTAFELGQNVPNPFNPNTKIRLSLPVASAYTISIYDIGGRLVRTYTGNAAVTTVSITWDGTDDAGNRVGSGLYFYKAQAGSFTETKKMVLLK